ncbi:MAG: tetratricopeptide repeat protein, partial [Saprospiraceae bacterium]|nr:tetratricopeptide repeat protein [Saprospiraceae bacterium]
EMLKEIPDNETEKLAAHLKIQEALFKLGSLYRDRLNNNEQAVRVLLDLNRRYPENKYELDSWYYLYLAYGEMGQTARADEYKQKIIGKYPSSTYGQLLINPAYAEQLRDREAQLNQYYDLTYEAFQNGNYETAYDRSQKARLEFGANNALRAKFALLAAMCIGQLKGEEAYKKALTEVVGKYPDTDEQRRAREILRLLGGAVAALPGQQEDLSGAFSPGEDQLHYILVALYDDANFNQSKVSVSDYNQKYHRLDKLRIANVFLGEDEESRLPVIVVRRFNDKAEAMTYYRGVMQNRNDFLDRSVNYDIFAISQENYRQVLRSRSLNGYEQFFQQAYLQ